MLDARSNNCVSVVCVNERHRAIKRLLDHLNTVYSLTKQTEFEFRGFRAVLMDVFGPDIPRRINPLIEYLQGVGIINIVVRGRTKFVILNPEKLSAASVP